MSSLLKNGVALLSTGVVAAGALKGVYDANKANEKFTHEHVVNGVQDVLIGGAVLGLGVAALALSSVPDTSKIEAPASEEKTAAPKPTPKSTPKPAASSKTSNMKKTVAGAAVAGGVSAATRHAAASAFGGTDAVDTAETLTDGAEAVGNMSDAADALDGDIVMDVLSGVFF